MSSEQSNYAVVIGIDGYTNPRWRLQASVADALDFAAWAVTSGGVAPANLHLLLSPGPDAGLAAEQVTLPGTGVQANYRRADDTTIVETIQKFQDGLGQGAARLYFYYAGHGSSAPSLGVDTALLGPVLIPASVERLPRDYKKLIGFSEVFPCFREQGPAEQFFFIDACRDFALENFARAATPTVGRYIGPPVKPDAPRRDQFIIYSTGPGQTAAEMERGVFGKLLLKALRGDPGAMLWAPNARHYELRFRALWEHLRRQVQRTIDGLLLPNWQDYLQLPEFETPLWKADTVLSTFSIEQVSKIPLRVRVSPSAARRACSVRVSYYIPGTAVAVKSVGPPTPLPADFELSPGDYSIQVESLQYSHPSVPVSLIAPVSLDLELEPSAAPAPAPSGHTALDVRAFDDRALVAVWGPGGTPYSGVGRIHISEPEPGIYRARLVLPDVSVEEKLIEVKRGARVDVTLEAPRSEMGTEQLEMLNQLNLAPGEANYLDPSELMGKVAGSSLASLLGFAAYAAYCAKPGDMTRLRSIGVEPVVAESEEDAWAVVLIGVSGDNPARRKDGAEFLTLSRLTVTRFDGEVVAQAGVELLPRFSAAAQRQIRLRPGSYSLELRLSKLSPTSYAITALPGRASIVVVVVADDGSAEVQQYSLPLKREGQDAPPSETMTPEALRLVEQAQRFYAGSQPMPREMISQLLDLKLADPLLGCLAGYTLLRHGLQEYFRGTPIPDSGPEEFEPSPMRNMLKFFGGLPDSHVLAGLCEPERRAEHYANAVQRGVPIFFEGFRALYSFYQESPPGELAFIQRTLLPSSPWTAWVPRTPVFIIERGRFSAVPNAWGILESHRAALEEIIPSVGRIAYAENSSTMPAGTGFLIADDLLLTTDFVAAMFCEVVSDGLRLDQSKPAYVTYDEEPEAGHALQHRIVEVIGVDRESRLAVLRQERNADDRDASRKPIPLAGPDFRPARARKVCAIGYPFKDTRNEPEAMQHAFNGIYGVKRLQPGEILDVPESKITFDHDCFTLGGNAGSPVIDIETERAIGLHFAGRYLGYKRGTAAALWKLRDHPLLRSLSG